MDCYKINHLQKKALENTTVVLIFSSTITKTSNYISIVCFLANIILTVRVSYKTHYTNGVQYITMYVIDLKGTLVHRHNVGDV